MSYAVYLAHTSGRAIGSGYGVNPNTSPVHGRMFLENGAVVKTFLTDAKYDLVESITWSLARRGPGFSNRIVALPYYESSGHSVSSAQPEKLLAGGEAA